MHNKPMSLNPSTLTRYPPIRRSQRRFRCIRVSAILQQQFEDSLNELYVQGPAEIPDDLVTEL